MPRGTGRPLERVDAADHPSDAQGSDQAARGLRISVPGKPAAGGLARFAAGPPVVGGFPTIGLTNGRRATGFTNAREITGLPIALFTVIAPSSRASRVVAFAETNGAKFSSSSSTTPSAPSRVIARVFETSRSTQRARDRPSPVVDRSIVARRRLSRDVQPFETSVVLTPRARVHISLFAHTSHTVTHQTKDVMRFLAHPSIRPSVRRRRRSRRATRERDARKRRERAERTRVGSIGRPRAGARARGDGENVGRGCSRRQHPSGSSGDEGRRARGDLGAAAVEG